MKTGSIYDLFIIGGGINGCGIARDAAGRGLSVCLAEKSDLGSGTSSGSTKLIHGGLRYLQYCEFGLVRKALIEREVLLRNAPHIVRPLRFVLPHHKGQRPEWLIRFGLFLYDHLGGRKLLPGTEIVDFTRSESGKPLKSKYKKGFEYSDCWVDDARLVVLNARDASGRGANILVRTEVVAARRGNGIWTVRTRNSRGLKQCFRARTLINASGPWMDHVLDQSVGRANDNKIRMVRGSHIVVPGIFCNRECYILQNADGRIVFAIPYEEEFTLIGTTDSDFRGDPGEAGISDEEIDYLCDSVNGYFTKEVFRPDVIWSYSAVRPLLEDGGARPHAATRDYRIEIEGDEDNALLVNICGGKITTYRRLAEDVLEKIARFLPVCGSPWTATSPLPGGNFPVDGYSRAVSELMHSYNFLGRRHARRLVRQYGTEACRILGSASCYSELGRCFGSDLYETEVLYQVDNEWARRAEDVIWRRTKEGLRLTEEQTAQLDEYLHNVSMQRAI